MGRLTWRLWVLILMGLLLGAPAWTVRGLPVGLADLAIAGTVAAYLIQRRPVPLTLLLATSAIWVGALALSLHGSLHLDNGLRVLRIGEALSLLLLLPLNLGLTFENAKWWLLGGGGLSLVIGVLDFATNRDLGAASSPHPLYLILSNHAFLRPGGVFGDPAQLGIVAAIVILVSLMLMFWSGWPGLLCGMAGLCLGGLVLAITASRSAWLFLAVAAAIVLMLDGRRKHIGLTITAGLLLSVAALFVIHPSGLADYIQQRAEQGDPTTGRLQRWMTIWGNFWNTPQLWLTGLGYKSFSDNPEGNVLIQGYRSSAPFYSIDNTYLSALVETGLIGLAAMCAWIVAMTLGIIRAAHGRLQGLTLALFAGLLAEALTVDALTYYRIIGLVALLVAILPGQPSGRTRAMRSGLTREVFTSRVGS